MSVVLVKFVSWYIFFCVLIQAQIWVLEHINRTYQPRSKFGSTYERTCKFWSTEECTYNCTYKLESTYKRSFEFRSTYKRTYEGSYVRFFAPGSYLKMLYSFVRSLNWCVVDSTLFLVIRPNPDIGATGLQVEVTH